MYIPQSQSFNSNEILKILRNVSTTIILLGNLNSWSPLWGSTTDNQRGNIIEDVLLTSNLVVLNDGSPTHFSTHQSFTNVDILCNTDKADWLQFQACAMSCFRKPLPLKI